MRRGSQSLHCNTRQTNRSIFYNNQEAIRIWSSDQVWGGAQLSGFDPFLCSTNQPLVFFRRSGKKKKKCSGDWLLPWPWCASVAYATVCRLIWWADWSYRGTTGWSCAGESSSEQSFSPVVAPGGDDPQRGTRVSHWALINCLICAQ